MTEISDEANIPGQLELDVSAAEPYHSFLHDQPDGLTARFIDLLSDPLTDDEMKEIDRMLEEAGIDPDADVNTMTPESEARLLQAIERSEVRGFWGGPDQQALI